MLVGVEGVAQAHLHPHVSGVGLGEVLGQEVPKDEICWRIKCLVICNASFHQLDETAAENVTMFARPTNPAVVAL